MINNSGEEVQLSLLLSKWTCCKCQTSVYVKLYNMHFFCEAYVYNTILNILSLCLFIKNRLTVISFIISLISSKQYKTNNINE